MRTLKILLVKTSSMGDLVHALPAVTDIVRAYPNAQIDWLAERPFDAIARLHPAVHKVIPIAWRKWRKTLWRSDTRQSIHDFWLNLRSEHYDVVIDLQGLVKSAVMSRMAKLSHHTSDDFGTPNLHLGYSGYDGKSIREPMAARAYHHRFNVSRQDSAVSRNRQLAAAVLGYPLNDAIDFGLHTLAMPRDWTFLGAHHVTPAPPWVAIIHGASRDEKLWDEANWLELIKHVATQGQRCLLLWGSQAERMRSERLYEAAVQAHIATELLPIVPPFLTILQVAQCLAASQSVVGLDSGFTHLAAALARPTVGIYADFDPQLAALMGVNYCIGLGGVGTPPTAEIVIKQLMCAQHFDQEYRHLWADGQIQRITRSSASRPDAVLHHMQLKDNEDNV
ncbi:lipopolysaccharide heptosyltransferase I [Hydromonas duriensis]|uniref:Lipopolysaccharide heptosyltransferase 1 n=1 Tax=Hydromonas duriensis TaxID=1527608 RepID=A0A4R6Y7H9_9BURK|nr:lipopolysaccharide heptosyltransferase I [Hydromonas duriensis]TDR31291.1 heptosyltransferase-1 [Hydromonas duriensis]